MLHVNGDDQAVVFATPLARVPPGLQKDVVVDIVCFASWAREQDRSDPR